MGWFSCSSEATGKKETSKSKHVNLALSHIYEERLSLSS